MSHAMTTASRRSLVALVLGTLLLALLVAFGVVPACSRHLDPRADEGTPVDTEIMAFLSEARALHHEANLKEESGDLPGAVSAVERLVAARRPHPDRTGAIPQSPPEIEEVLADAYARLAELRLKQGQLDPAAGAVKSGLEHVAEATYFRGHLVEVQGLVEEARAAQLADAGNAAEAAKAREHAIQLLEEVVKIQDQVIQRSLGKDGG
jgi:tetratricopeptide (TPR) repeat protein